MPSPKRSIVAEVTFLSPEDGGRVQLPEPAFHTRYSPHIVIQSPDVRGPVLHSWLEDTYLGVIFLKSPSDYAAGKAGQFQLGLVYYPDVNYDALKIGATFTVREGPQIVGFGTVLSFGEETEEPCASNTH